MEDKIKGVIFGNAVGDAIGLGTEFMSKAMVQHHYPNGLTDYKQIVQDKHRSRWQLGEWTDDTHQMLCILDSLLANKRIDIKDIGLTIVDWAHNDGRGTGRTIYTVIGSPLFMNNPHKAAEEYWLKSKKYAAANGALMRTSVLGIWEYNNPEKIRLNAEKVCKITHYDPRCVGSCVMLCLMISRLLQGQIINDDFMEEMLQEGDRYDARIREYLTAHVRPDIAVLALEDKASIGYTLKALGCAWWALQYSSSFEKGISKIIHEGGDADTNAAIAGAVLGARFGYENIPQRWLNGLAKKDWLLDQVKQLISAMDMS
ncbi:ADP-ribosylglycohydrolase family protein [Microscilla marina]|uniref:ADP-ribosylglycohydrolase superfamily n=1 Tax=Microscilla marina ATCC 23134 TaxID=313606 RepID=A1ZEV1_MICM2|nr:ADP-ribosylglycohydrolase family protein [Microscilla marina]EAY31053.1 ADP-ribosylglycohydrolase superfamily [Microscilla marina ATCC 23134]